eukprot:1956175-Rhodomonas_salina.1
MGPKAVVNSESEADQVHGLSRSWVRHPSSSCFTSSFLRFLTYPTLVCNPSRRSHTLLCPPLLLSCIWPPRFQRAPRLWFWSSLRRGSCLAGGWGMRKARRMARVEMRSITCEATWDNQTAHSTPERLSVASAGGWG